MERVLDIYKMPYNAELPVVCMDEMPKQLIEEGKHSIAMKPGQDARVDYEYIRHGLVNKWYPKARKIKLVMDNFKTHDPSSFYETFEPAEAKRLWDRFEFIYTPKHGSWLNMAEIELHVLNGQCLNRHLSSMKKIKEEVEAWQTNRNNKNSKINWQFTNKEARVKLKRLYPSIYD
jgi:DDE superfamily endonuclease